MKILSLVTNRHAPFYEVQTTELESKGVEIDHVYPRKQSKSHEIQQNISRSYIDYFPLIYRVLPKALSEYDIVHANNGKTAPFALIQPHRPIVLTLWGSDLMGRYRTLCKKSAAYCDEVIVMSEEMESELGQNAHVIPHGIDLDQFAPMSQAEARSAVNWDGDVKHILFPYDPAREVKNYPLAKQIVKQAQNKLPMSLQLQVVSDVRHDQVPLYMNAADVLLITSRREGFPNSVKEAMACNLPIVSTDVGGIRDRLEDVDNSYVSNSEGELVARLCEVLSNDRRSNGRRYVADLSQEQMGKQIINVYKKALK